MALTNALSSHLPCISLQPKTSYLEYIFSRAILKRNGGNLEINAAGNDEPKQERYLKGKIAHSQLSRLTSRFTASGRTRGS